MLILWLGIFITDVVCAFTIGKPVFMIARAGGDITQYIGLGYGITRSYANVC